MRDCGRAFDLGHQDGVGARPRDGRNVGLAPRGAESIAANDNLALAVGLALRRQYDVRARGLLGVRRDRILEVEDQGVGRQGPCLLQRARVGARHIEHTAARTNGGHVTAPRKRGGL